MANEFSSSPIFRIRCTPCRGALQAADLSCQLMEHAWETHDVMKFTQQEQREPLLTLARGLPEGRDELPAQALDEFAPPIAVIVAERYPLPAGDERIEQFVQSLPGRGSLVFCYDLEQPLLRLFFGDWARDTLVKLGLEEDECVESRMVSRRVRDAQRRIEQAAHGDFESTSDEEWFRRNMSE